MKLYVGVLLICVCVSPFNAVACTTPVSVCESAQQGSFPLIENGRPVDVVYETSTNMAVQIAIENFANDLKRISGKRAKLIADPKKVKKPTVIVGVLGQSKLLEDLIAAKKINVEQLRGQWEAYQIAVVEHPWPDVESALVIVGSDRRGAVYGIYDLSENMGVSPWYWFADVPVVKKKQVHITAGTKTDQPKVQYRGIFLNDEDPALSGWAINKFGGVNSKMYGRIFELILRLKGNYIWPAMWSKAFYLDDPKNITVADNMGIVVGTSHHEPMALAHKEWGLADAGAWNYNSNAENLRKFWQSGIARMMSKGNGVPYDTLVTVGMRGDGDEPMSEGTAINLLENIVADQRNIIANVTGKPAEDTPQVWALYKEVQDYYDKGMRVPDDITLLFSDDNWGQIRRLPTGHLDRKGGFGVYYHFDYVGVPRNYKWTNTVQIEKVWQQMNLAYQRGAKNIWIVNVGDLKPVEFPVDFFLSMAWNPETMTVDSMTDFAENWVAKTFGSSLASEIGNLITRYSQYAAMRKPELINERTFPIGHFNNKELIPGDFYEIVEKWNALNSDMKKAKIKITEEQESAFFQLVEYPIASLANLYNLYFAVAWNRAIASHHDERANHFLKLANEAFDYDAELTYKYHTINNGKWDGMMNQVHMNYVIWNEPTQQTLPPVIRVAGGRNKIDVVFSSKEPSPNVVELEASAYERLHSNSGVSWAAVPNLGQSKAAMISLPQGQPATGVADEVFIEYSIKAPQSGDLEISLQLSPTLDTMNNKGIRVGVSLDEGSVKTLVFNLISTGGGAKTPEERAWWKAAEDNRHVIKAVFENVKTGDHKLKVWRIDDNVVLEKLIVRTHGG